MIIEYRSDETYKQNKERAAKAFELEILRTVLARNNGNIAETARNARIDRKYLCDLIVKHDLRSYVDSCRIGVAK